MGTTITGLVADNSTDARFRAWGSAISTAIAALGLVQTSDTGQINWTTVTHPTTTNAAAGYEIWRFADSQQSAAPVFIKLEYGSQGTASGVSPEIYVTVGTGSDGAGTITGTNISNVYGAITTRSTVFVVASAASSGANTGSVYVYGDSGCLAILAWPNLSSIFGGGLLLIERWRNWDGTNSADGVTVFTAGSGSGGGANLAQSLCFLPNVAINPGAQSAIASNSVQPQAGLTLTVSALGTTLYPLPIFTGPGPRAGAPSQYILGVGMGDYAGNSTFTMSHYGVSRTWIAAGLGQSTTPGWGSIGNAGNLKSFIFRIS